MKFESLTEKDQAETEKTIDVENRTETSSEEVESAVSQIKEALRNQTEKLSNFSETDILELAELDNALSEDPASLVEQVDSSDLEQWTEDIVAFINSVSEKGNMDKLVEFLTKNNRPIKAFTVAVYFSTMGSALADSLMGSGVQIESDNGEKTSFDDLANNPEFRETIEDKQGIPVDILQGYAVAPLLNEEGFSVDFRISENDEGEKEFGIRSMGTYHVQGEAEEVQEDYKKMGELIHSVVEDDDKWTTDATALKITMENFQDNKEKIIGEMSSIMNISEDKISNYFEKVIEANEQEYRDEKVSAVSMEEWNINEEFQAKGDIAQKYEEIMDKYDLSNSEEKTEATEEFEKWGEDNGYDNVYEDLGREELENPFAIAESHETIGVMTEDIYSKVIEDDLKNKFEEEEYDLEELNNDPEKAFSILCDLVAERKGVDDPAGKEAIKSNLEMWWTANDYEDTKKIVNGEKLDKIPTIVEATEFENFKENFKELVLNGLEKNGYDFDKLSEIAKENPKEVINILSDYVSNEYSDEDGYDGNARSSIFMGVKHQLTETGISNLDKFAVVQTSEGDGRIVSTLIAEDDDKLKTTSIDFHLTDDEVADNEKVEEKVDKAHKSVTDKIKELNLREKLRQIL
ncbi:MAG: hypothetical protein U9P70_04515 [Patescibacteria group bacterium]|nr:hypothetical protein [Patescibacteria group bacterium]